MKGYVARKGNCWYAVVYEGVDPTSGRERRSWHAAGTERADASGLQRGSPPSATAATTAPVRSVSPPT